MNVLTWLGILFCITQSAILSGLNLAIFTVSKLELRLEVAKGNRLAQRILAMREDANFLLVTILWGNVGVNVLLAMLSDSTLAGVAAFVFSTVIITIFGEIFPQAFFSRRALRFGALFAPVLRCYQILLYPVAKPTALLLDRLVGPEAITYFKERDIRELIKLHMESSQSDIEKVEGLGALNFLALDDLPLRVEGEPLDPASIVRLPFEGSRPVFPAIDVDTRDPFLQSIHVSGKKWIVLVDDADEPRLVMDSDEFIRDALFNTGRFNPYRHCHRPIIVRSDTLAMGDIITRLNVKPDHCQDDVVDHDVILVWDEHKRVITGADVLGRLLRGIVRNPLDESNAPGCA